MPYFIGDVGPQGEEGEKGQQGDRGRPGLIGAVPYTYVAPGQLHVITHSNYDRKKTIVYLHLFVNE